MQFHSAHAHGTRVAPSCGPRNVYLDLGASWCNTMQLYDEIEETRARAGPWLVAALEASPLIAPHVARCAAALTEGLPLPESPVPPTGSSDHLYRFVRDHPTLRQCWRRTHQEFNREGKLCVMQHPEVVANMSRLAADPSLATRGAVHDAMSQTAACPERSTFVAVNAAADAADGEVRMQGGNPEQLILGGSKPRGSGGTYPITQRNRTATFTIQSVDVVRWIRHSVRPQDFLFLKMDIEGFEHKLVPALVAANVTRLVDVLVWECHYGNFATSDGAPARCHKLRALLNNDTNFRGRVYEEQPACTFQSNRTGCWRCGMNCGRRRRR